jgi:hypothetical protein
MKCQKLRSLNLNNTPCLTEAVLEEVLKVLPCLEELFFYSPSGEIGQDFVAQLRSRYTSCQIRS